jgi:hypothetical protein
MSSLLLFISRGRVSPRRATDFLLLRQKKVSKEKATLLSATLRFATGNLRCSAPVGVRRTRFAQTAAALIPPAPSTAGAYRRAFGRAIAALGRAKPTANTNHPSHPNDSNHRGRCASAVAWRPSEAMARLVSKPLWLRRGAERFADQGRSCLSEASSGRTPRNASTAGCPVAKRRGRRQWGRLFFCLLSLAKQKKSRSACRARPGLGKQTQEGVQTSGAGR